ncbi:MAG TPA: hypothetical protein VFZ83_11580 [Acidimicrobiia bacterium]|nr:hypothetical protein [Acidimicrobiia bacterium]
MRRLATIVTTTALLAGTAACGNAAADSDGSIPTGSSNPPVTELAPPGSEPPRTTVDIPRGFSVGPARFDTDEVFCDDAGPFRARGRGAFEVAYQGGILGPFVVTGVGTYDDVDALYDGFTRAVEACSTDATTRFRAVAFPTLGNRTYAARFTTAIGVWRLHGALVVISVGSRAATITALSTRALSNSQLLRHAEAAYARLAV